MAVAELPLIEIPNRCHLGKDGGLEKGKNQTATEILLVETQLQFESKSLLPTASV